MKLDPAVKAEAVRLRVVEHLGLKVIASRLGISKGTASLWLRDHPLPEVLVQERQVSNGQARRGHRKPRKPPQVREVTARFREVIEARKYTNQQLGSIAETAVLFRLHLHQFDVFMPASDGSRIDWIVVDPQTGRASKVQVKSVYSPRPGRGLPSLPLRCAVGTKNGESPVKYRKYTKEEFDFLVGYDLVTDTCYVWSFAEVEHLKAAVTVCSDAAERWDKLRSVAQPG